jgi:hypothetical protein
MDYFRKQAKSLHRAHRAGDGAAVARAQAVLPNRDRFLLADAQHVIAVEGGFRSWSDLKHQRVRWLESDVRYGDGAPVRIRVRKRGRRIDIDDAGETVRRAGAPRGWLEVATRVAAEECVNVNRAGVVFVPVVERRGTSIDDIAHLVARASAALHSELLDEEF